MAAILSGSQRKGPMARTKDPGKTSEHPIRRQIQGRQRQLSTLADDQDPRPLRGDPT